jgi:hypothetical protein
MNARQREFYFTLDWQDQKQAADIEAPRLALNRLCRLVVELTGLILLLGLIDLFLQTRHFWLLAVVTATAGCWVYFALYPILIDLRTVYWLRSRTALQVNLSNEGIWVNQSSSSGIFHSWDSVTSVRESDAGVLFRFDASMLSKLILGPPKVWLPARIFGDSAQKDEVLRFARQTHGQGSTVESRFASAEALQFSPAVLHPEVPAAGTGG